LTKRPPVETVTPPDSKTPFAPAKVTVFVEEPRVAAPLLVMPTVLLAVNARELPLIATCEDETTPPAVASTLTPVLLIRIIGETDETDES
jgi:hypothetical protein